jgi:hypothetical protein
VTATPPEMVVPDGQVLGAALELGLVHEGLRICPAQCRPAVPERPSWAGSPSGPVLVGCPNGLEGGLLAPSHNWLWIPKGSANPTLGFPAQRFEVRRFRSSARTLSCTPTLAPLSRTFAAVVVGKRQFDNGEPTDGRRQTGGGSGGGGARGHDLESSGGMSMGGGGAGYC